MNLYTIKKAIERSVRVSKESILVYRNAIEQYKDDLRTAEKERQAAIPGARIDEYYKMRLYAAEETIEVKRKEIKKLKIKIKKETDLINENTEELKKIANNISNKKLKDKGEYEEALKDDKISDTKVKGVWRDE